MSFKQVLNHISFRWCQTKMIPNNHKLLQMKHETGCFHSMSGLFATMRLCDGIAALFICKSDFELTELSILANFESGDQSLC